MHLPWTQGHAVVLSAPWYLNLGGYASRDWMQYYDVDPAPPAMKRKVRP